MAIRKSKNYNLTLQDNDEFVDIETTAGNFEKLDDELHKISEKTNNNGSFITELETNVSGLKKDLAELKESVESGGTISDEIAQKIVTIENDISRINPNIANLKTRLTSAESGIVLAEKCAGTENKQNTKLMLVGAETYGSVSKTCVNSDVYIGDDNCLYSGRKKVVTNVADFKSLEEFKEKRDNKEITLEDPISVEGAAVIASEASDLECLDIYYRDSETGTAVRNTVVEGSGAIGSGNFVYPKFAMAVGTDNEIGVNKKNSMAVGFENEVGQSNSLVVGEYNEVACIDDTNWDFPAFVAGYKNVAYGLQTIVGKYADTSNTPANNKGPAQPGGTTGSVFIVGNGILDTNRSNAFRVSGAGQCYGLKTFLSSGADFAEYFEWADGNPNGEDRRGRIVTLDGEKIRYANADDDYILGVISTLGAFVGNTYSDSWKGKYQTDIFGEWLTEEIDIPEKIETHEVEEKDEKTGKTVIKTVERVVPAHKETRYVLNTDYDPEQEYISREFRKEWSPVGFHGQLVVLDDGTCEVNGYCKSGNEGIATKSDIGYRVMRRLDDTHVKILVK